MTNSDATCIIMQNWRENYEHDCTGITVGNVIRYRRVYSHHNHDSTIIL